MGSSMDWPPVHPWHSLRAYVSQTRTETGSVCIAATAQGVRGYRSVISSQSSVIRHPLPSNKSRYLVKQPATMTVTLSPVVKAETFGEAVTRLALKALGE